MNRSWISIAVLGLALAGCEDKSAPLAPAASALEPVKSAAAGAQSFAIDRDSGSVEFLMDAPSEKIHGKVMKSTTGELQIDPTDITKTVGVVHVNIHDLEVFQAKVDDKGTVENEHKDEQQNTHVRNWLEIAGDVPDAQKKANEDVAFSIKKVEAMGTTDVTKVIGANPKVTFKATGDFLLHGHKTEKTVELEATFKMDGSKPVSVDVKTVKPFAVGLEENDVKPREAFGKLALKGLDVLSKKVAKEAEVSVAFTAKATGLTPNAPAKAP